MLRINEDDVYSLELNTGKNVSVNVRIHHLRGHNNIGGKFIIGRSKCKKLRKQKQTLKDLELLSTHNQRMRKETEGKFAKALHTSCNM